MSLSDTSELVHPSNYELLFIAQLILRDDAYRNRQPSPRWTCLNRETKEAYMLLAHQWIQTWDTAR